jgi:regulator of nucleoside diphosphate kinase
MNRVDPVVSDVDRCRLGTLLTTEEGRAWGSHYWLEELESRLEDASSIDSGHVPATLVTMNSTVKLVDDESGASRTVTLIYPQDFDVVLDGVSVFEPLGIALLGGEEGDVVQCPDELCGRHMRIDQIEYQPERSGARYL